MVIKEFEELSPEDFSMDETWGEFFATSVFLDTEIKLVMDGDAGDVLSGHVEAFKTCLSFWEKSNEEILKKARDFSNEVLSSSGKINGLSALEFNLLCGDDGEPIGVSVQCDVEGEFENSDCDRLNSNSVFEIGIPFECGSPSLEQIEVELIEDYD